MTLSNFTLLGKASFLKREKNKPAKHIMHQNEKYIKLSKDSNMFNVHSRFTNIEIILPCSFVKPHFGPILSSSTRNLGIFGNGVTLLCYVDCFEADKDEKSRQTKVS